MLNELLTGQWLDANYSWLVEACWNLSSWPKKIPLCKFPGRFICLCYFNWHLSNLLAITLLQMWGLFTHQKNSDLFIYQTKIGEVLFTILKCALDLKKRADPEVRGRRLYLWLQGLMLPQKIRIKEQMREGPLLSRNHRVHHHSSTWVGRLEKALC